MLTPKFFDAKKISDLYLPNLQTVKAEAENLKVAPSTTDKEKVALLLIDCQIDFCLNIGSLYVNNADNRGLLYLYNLFQN